MLANGFRQSADVGGYDTAIPSQMHKRFFFEGPRMVEGENAGGQVHQSWEMDIRIGYEPIPADPDGARWEAIDDVATLHAAWNNDATITSDAFSIQSTELDFLENGSGENVWQLSILVAWQSFQTA